MSFLHASLVQRTAFSSSCLSFFASWASLPEMGLAEMVLAEMGLAALPMASISRALTRARETALVAKAVFHRPWPTRLRVPQDRTH